MVSVVGTCVLLLTIISVSAAQSKAFVELKCTSENHGEIGKDSILKCDINPSNEAKDAKITVVTWKKTGNEKPLVAFQLQKNPQLTEKTRFHFSMQNLNESTRDVSLIVSKTQINDSGEYECYVMTDQGSDKKKISLSVTAKYSTPKEGETTFELPPSKLGAVEQQEDVIETKEKVPAVNIVAPVVVIGSLIVGLLVLLLLRRRCSNGGANHTPNDQDEEKANLQDGEGAEAEGP